MRGAIPITVLLVMHVATYVSDRCRDIALVALFVVLAACHEQYSRDPKVAGAYAAAAGGLAIAQAVAQSNASSSSSSSSNREAPVSGAETDLHALRRYTVDAINRFRAEHEVAVVSSSDPLHEFAQRGSEWLQGDHEAGKHLRSDARCSSRCGESQGRAYGEPTAPSEMQIDAALETMQNDPDRSAILLASGWRFVGVGIVSPGGTMYLTIDLTKVDFE